MSRYPIREVSANELRDMFNNGKYWERVQSGELRQVVRTNNHPSRPKANEPFCTRSQFISYYDKNGREIAQVHQYLRTDGSLGASGKPDPKSILFNLELYVVVEP